MVQIVVMVQNHGWTWRAGGKGALGSRAECVVAALGDRGGVFPPLPLCKGERIEVRGFAAFESIARGKTTPRTVPQCAELGTRKNGEHGERCARWIPWVAERRVRTRPPRPARAQASVGTVGPNSGRWRPRSYQQQLIGLLCARSVRNATGCNRATLHPDACPPLEKERGGGAPTEKAAAPASSQARANTPNAKVYPCHEIKVYPSCDVRDACAPQN